MDERVAADRGGGCGNIGNVVNAPTERFIELLGESAPTRRWGVRPLAPLAIVRALRAAAGMPTIDPTAWEDATADALAGLSSPADPFAPFAGLFPLPPDPLDRMDKPDHLFELIVSLAYFREWNKPLGLLGHLMGETVALLRAGIGQGKQQLFSRATGRSERGSGARPVTLSTHHSHLLWRRRCRRGAENQRYSGGEELAKRFQLGIDASSISTIGGKWMRTPFSPRFLQHSTRRPFEWIRGSRDWPIPG